MSKTVKIEMKKTPIEIIKFHKDMFICLLKAMRNDGISTYEDIISHKAKGLLDEPLWKIVEAYGKYKVNYISEGIEEIANKLNMGNSINVTIIENYLINNIDYQLKNSIIISNKKDCKVQLEHVTPRKKIIEEILKLKTESAIRKYLDDMCVGCLVLKAEHKMLDDNVCNNGDLWKRYKQAGIKVFDKKGGVWVY